MKHIILLTFLFCSSSIFSQECDIKTVLLELKKDVRDKFSNIEVNKNASKLAKDIENTPLSKSSYMTKWSLKRDNQRGPWAMKGNTLVIGVKDDGIKDWMEKVGKKSFGLGFWEHPEDAAGHSPYAVLRVGEKFYPFRTIKEVFNQQISLLSNNETVTEATFMATEAELKAINKFIADRLQGNIKAVRNLKSYTSSSTGVVQDINIGDVIKPQYKHDGNNLYRESCAGTCTSMFNPKWLEHYDAPTSLILASIAMNNGITPVVNSKEFIFSNFRNTNASAISILGLVGNENVKKDMDFSGTRGMMWAFIPDLPEGKTSENYFTKRYDLKEWSLEND